MTDKLRDDFNKLRPKQKKWVQIYAQCGNATEAAKRAGYGGTNQNRIGCENLSKLSKYLTLYEPPEEPIKPDPAIADMEEVKRFWTEIIRNSDNRLTDRLKASELRAKAAGAFTINLDVGNKNDKPFELISDLSIDDKLAVIDEIKNE